MPGEVKLKPCPFCGNDKKLVIRRSDCDNRFIRCYECGAEGPFYGEDDEVVAAWNRRAPVPETKMLSNDDLAQDMAECIFTCNWESIDDLKSYIVSFLNDVESKKSGTSVISWTRYDGTPETLPDFGEKVLLTKASQRKFYPVTAEFEIFGGLKVWNDFTNRTDVYIGDFWAYLPEPPERME